jgi:hypothetical protein
MKITIELNKKAYAIRMNDNPETMTHTVVRVDGKRSCLIEDELRNDELNGRFDILWKHLGMRVKGLLDEQ